MPKIRIERPNKQKLDLLGVSDWSPWESEVRSFDWSYDSDEVCYILEGKVKVKTPEEEVEINSGDLVTFPKGLKCNWNVLKKLKKVYVFK